ncbi:MAG: malto-oligosyltrehalose synthase, partial [Myxococcaceae bacterium]
LRIDHPDGLFDPTAYFQQLQERYFLVHAEKHFSGPPEDWKATAEALTQKIRAELAADPLSLLRLLFYVVVEKIQGGRERIPESWAVAGTTGYRFANGVGGIFVDSKNERAFTEIYEKFIGRGVDVAEMIYEKKKLIMRVSMASERNVLARELNRISEMNRRTRDFTLNSLRHALTEFVAHFPVYRTYVDSSPELDERDTRYIRWTIARAKQKDTNTNASIYDFLQSILLRRYPEHLNDHERATMLRFAMKLQQFTGPVMAKGLEDTVFYLYNRFVFLNEVGGEPERFGTSVSTFHLRNQERAEKWPGALVASSTHDTKRGEDTRARLVVLSELPEVWRDHVTRWAKVNARYKRFGAPDANDEYLFYQTLLGAWPMGDTDDFDGFRKRVSDYMLKAIREGKLHTSWTNPDADYEQAMVRFVEAVLSPDNRAFLDEARAFKKRLERPGQITSLAQTLLKIASPGTPDVYQGSELWDLSLVDPDNRRPVDFTARATLLEFLQQARERDRAQLCTTLQQDMTNGAAKLYVLTEGLQTRQRHTDLLREGTYLPLDAAGRERERLVGFARSSKDTRLIAAVPRLITALVESGKPLAQAFGDTWLKVPEGMAAATFRDVFTGKTRRVSKREGAFGISASELFELFPVALLEG